MTIWVREPSLLPAIVIDSRAFEADFELTEHNTTFPRVPTTTAHHYIHVSTINGLNVSSQWTNLKKISTSYNSTILFSSLSLKKEVPCGHLKFSKTFLAASQLKMAVAHAHLEGYLCFRKAHNTPCCCQAANYSLRGHLSGCKCHFLSKPC